MWIYGMKERPAGLGCQPKEGLVEILQGTVHIYNFLCYNRKLTEKEIADYELTPMDTIEAVKDGSYQRIINEGEEVFNLYRDDGFFIGTFSRILEE